VRRLRARNRWHTIGRRVPRKLVRVREQPARLLLGVQLWDGRDLYEVDDLHDRMGTLWVLLRNVKTQQSAWFPVLLQDAEGVGVLWYADSGHRLRSGNPLRR
jgi:hypothetical protein